MLKKISVLLLALAVLPATGCGPNCQSTCNKLYGNGDGECNITRPGADNTQEKLTNTCMDACNDALSKPGEVGDYNPDNRHGSTVIILENEKQAAVWMDCVAETSCEFLESGGYCAPVW